jgi:hypothetical protein
MTSEYCVNEMSSAAVHLGCALPGEIVFSRKYHAAGFVVVIITSPLVVHHLYLFA